MEKGMKEERGWIKVDKKRVNEIKKVRYKEYEK